MYKKTIKYTDYNNVLRTEDHWFNISKAELILMENSVSGGMKQRLEKIIQSQDNVAIMEVLVDLIRKSYGVKSDDGKRFIKSQQLVDEFEQSEAFSEFLMELLSDPDAASTFVTNILPNGLINEADMKALPKIATT